MDTESRINLLPATTSRNAIIENPLFVATRTGATAPQIIDLIQESSDLNALNEDGQTFLFTLDPSICQNPELFHQLLKALDKRDFNFGHLDHSGRSFLSFLSIKPGFKIDCIELASRSVTCHCNPRPYHDATCLRSITRRRDAAGKFLNDYLNTLIAAARGNPGRVLNAYQWAGIGDETPKPSPTSIATFDMCFPSFAFPNSKRRIQLHEEDDEGRTKIGVQVIARGRFEKKDDADTKRPGDRDVKVELSHYDIYGETPLMGYFKTALEDNIDEDVVAERVEELLKLGANVDARSRHGRTLLHFAAKHTWPVVLQKLLELGAQLGTKDETGSTALDYLQAGGDWGLKMLKQERRRRKCVELLLKHDQQQPKQTKIGGGTSQVDADVETLASADDLSLIDARSKKRFHLLE